MALRHIAFVCVCALFELSGAVPVLGLDLPRELVMDTNKGYN